MRRTGETAKLLVIHHRGYGRHGPAHRASRIAGQLHLAELHVEGIVHQQTPRQRITDPQYQLYRLGRLDDADNARQNTKHARLLAAGHGTRRRGGRIDATVAPLAGQKHSGHTIEPVYAAVHVGFTRQHTGIVDQVACGEIVATVHYDVVSGYYVQCVARIKGDLVLDYPDVRIHVRYG